MSVETAPTARWSRRKRLRYTGFRAVLRMRQWSARPTASRRSLPDFLIVGAQRCGTTSVYRYLTQHPSVLFPHLTKGTHWFDEEYQRSEAWYRSTSRSTRSVRRGGSRPAVRSWSARAARTTCSIRRSRRGSPSISPRSSSSPCCATRWPGPGPQYNHEYRRAHESLSFEAALDAEEARLAGADEILLSGPHRHFAHQHYSLRRGGSLRGAARAALDPVDRDRCLVLYAADLERDPLTVMQRVHDFLGIPVRETAEHRPGERLRQQGARATSAGPARRRLRGVRRLAGRAPRGATAAAQITVAVPEYDFDVDEAARMDDASTLGRGGTLNVFGGVCFAILGLRAGHDPHPVAGRPRRRRIPRVGRGVQHHQPRVAAPAPTSVLCASCPASGAPAAPARSGP